MYFWRPELVLSPIPISKELPPFFLFSFFFFFFFLLHASRLNCKQHTRTFLGGQCLPSRFSLFSFGAQFSLEFTFDSRLHKHTRTGTEEPRDPSHLGVTRPFGLPHPTPFIPKSIKCRTSVFEQAVVSPPSSSSSKQTREKEREREEEEEEEIFSLGPQRQLFQPERPQATATTKGLFCSPPLASLKMQSKIHNWDAIIFLVVAVAWRDEGMEGWMTQAPSLPQGGRRHHRLAQD